MKATKTIPAEMLQNSDFFTNDFFKRFSLRKRHEPLKLTDKISKDYLFPTFYGDVTCAISIFLCSYDKAAKLVAEKLDPGIKPVKITRGRSLIAFSCYEYKNVMNVAPYNEIAMAIPIMVNAKLNPPLLPMVIDSFKHFGLYISGMPVTSYENQLRGNKIWGLPKVTQDIEIKQEGGDCVTVAYEESGEEYFRLRTPMDGKPTDFDISSYLYSKLDGKILQSETNFKATFNVNKHMNLLFKKSLKPDRTYLELGQSKSAKFLHDLEMEEHPFQTRYAEGMNSCFDLPESETPKWLNVLNQ